MTKRLLVIGFVWPEPKSSAAGSRMLQLIDLFKKQNYDITFATTTSKSDKAFDLTTIDVKTEHIKLNDSSFDIFIKTLNPDMVLFDRFMTEEQFGWRVREQCPHATRLLDTEDFHGLRKGRAEAVKKNELFGLKHLYNDTTKREIASIYRCDMSFIISEVEMEMLTKDFGLDNSLLFYLPFLATMISDNDIEALTTFVSRHHFITIGNFLHEPNYDAVLYLKKNIWPLIKAQLPKVEMHVYGAYESQKIKQLHNEKEGFLIKGYAKDADEVMQMSRVCLAPLRFGAGLKGKLIDAMKNGTPAVMSSIAAEGMFGECDLNGFIQDHPEKFAEKAVNLYLNEALWLEKQNGGFNVINQRFNIAHFEIHFIEKIHWLKINLESHRMQNFTGQLLWHHSLQSTKYMSKWIEQKNK